MVATITVNGADSLKAALATASAGTTIELAPGNYGHLGINVPWVERWGSFDGEVTIRSADPDNPATFSSMFMLGVKNLTVDGVVVDYSGTGKAVEVRDGTNIAIRNSVIKGDRLDDPSHAYDGLPVALGLSIRSSKGVAVENNEFSDWRAAASFLTSSDVVVSGNEVHTVARDGMTFVAVTDVLIENNHFHNFYTKDGIGDHRDMIQFWTAGTSTPSTGITIRDNVLNSGDGPWTQSIFMGNEVARAQSGQGMFYRDVVIENNVIYNGHLHGITVGEADGVKITNNTLLHNPDGGLEGPVARPRVNVAADALNVHVARNIAEAMPQQPGDAVNWKIVDNLIVQNTDPGAPNHYGALFINALTGGTDLAALQARPGSLVETGGYGSSLTRFNGTPEALTAVINYAGETGDMLAFDAGYTANGGGFLDADDATFRWEMGDGTVLSGAEIEHAFAPGTYTVKLTVTDAEGNSDDAQAKIYVPEPVRLDLDVTAQGLVDRSTYATPNLPAVKVEQGGGRYGARLTDKTGFGLERGVAPIHDLNAFTISLDLKAASGAASAGEIFRLHQSMALRVESDGRFVFDFTNNAGKVFQLSSAPTAALDGGWHDVTLTYDKWSGSLGIAVDGAEVGEVAASGASKPQEYWGLNFGSIWGKTAFDGLVDDFEVRSVGGGGGSDGPVVVLPEGPIELPETQEPAPAPEPEPEPQPEPQPAPQPEPQPAPGNLSFDLAIAYDDGKVIDADLTDGEVLALDDVDDGRVTLVATPSAEVGSVKLTLVDVHGRIESEVPYVLFGDEGGKFYSGKALGTGDYEMVLTAYSGEDGSGSILGSDTISFSIADGPAADAPAADRPAADASGAQIVSRWNAGTDAVAAVDGGPDWAADLGTVVGAAKLHSSTIPASGRLDASVPDTTPEGIFAQELYGSSRAAGMGLEFGGGALEDGTYAVRLYMGNGWADTDGVGERVFDVSVEDELFLDDLDLVAELGHQVGGMFEWLGRVDDGTVDIDFAHLVENPLVNGVEIVRLDDGFIL
jgi:PKD repeat protein